MSGRRACRCRRCGGMTSIAQHKDQARAGQEGGVEGEEGEVEVVEEVEEEVGGDGAPGSGPAAGPHPPPATANRILQPANQLSTGWQAPWPPGGHLAPPHTSCQAPPSTGGPGGRRAKCH